MNPFSIILLLLLGYLLQRISLEHCLDGISYETEADRRLVESQEEFRLITTLKNARRLPVFFLRLRETVPAGLHAEDPSVQISNAYHNRSYAYLEQSFYLLPQQQAVRTLPVSLPQRGRYLLRGADLTSGDLLGLKEKTVHFDRFKEIIVIPQRCRLGKLERSFNGYLGEASVRRFIMPDPIDTVGFREYSGREPQKDISWTETLKRNRLIVKQYDYTAEQRATVLLDITSEDSAKIEAAYSLARTVCEELEKKHIRFSFRTDAHISTPQGNRSYVPEGSGRKHLETVYEYLGRAGHSRLLHCEKLLESAVQNRSEQRSYILICAEAKNVQELVRRKEKELGQRIHVMDAREIER